ncbi:unnamed protein product [Protopolystoma xenopodis]|uniref:Uncharacterized protein n=1 Tax=Protopolystoma xenopodis TaxID=117903 RepID=A0A3S5AQB8_9PLAT|nr:unnamed protein product [Protopolystoma xenopodis]
MDEWTNERVCVEVCFGREMDSRSVCLAGGIKHLASGLVIGPFVSVLLSIPSPLSRSLSRAGRMAAPCSRVVCPARRLQPMV